MLDDLRDVHWALALGLFAAGAVGMALLLTLVFGGGTDSKAGIRPHHAPAARRSAVGGEAATAITGVGAGSHRVASAPSLATLVGQRFMVGVEARALTSTMLADVRKGQIGSIVIFATESTPADVQRATARLRAAAAAGRQPPLLISTDQEGGQVKRLPGPPQRPLSQLTPPAAQIEGQRTGSYLREYGINADLAPVVDLGLPQSFMAQEGRTISANPARVAAVASGFVLGLRSTRVMPVAKHFPGLGAATVSTDEARSVVAAPPGPALLPYQRLIDAGLPAVMLSTAVYPSLDPNHAAAWSPEIVEGVLRHRLGFRGLVMTDTLSSAGVQESLPVPQATVAAAQAGADILMIAEPEAFRPAYEAVLAAAESGHIPRRDLTDSYRRVLTAKREFGA